MYTVKQLLTPTISFGPLRPSLKKCSTRIVFRAVTSTVKKFPTTFVLERLRIHRTNYCGPMDPQRNTLTNYVYSETVSDPQIFARAVDVYG